MSLFTVKVVNMNLKSRASFIFNNSYMNKMMTKYFRSFFWILTIKKQRNYIPIPPVEDLLAYLKKKETVRWE